jgi:hypothetical protein
MRNLRTGTGARRARGDAGKRDNKQQQFRQHVTSASQSAHQIVFNVTRQIETLRRPDGSRLGRIAETVSAKLLLAAS